MSENWIPLIRPLDDDTTVVLMTNIEYAANAPDTSRPSVTVVRVELSDPGEDGFGSHEEVEAVDDRITALDLEGQTKACFVSRVRAGGFCNFFYYTPETSRDKIDEILQVGLQDLDFDVQHNDDPEWETYFGLLPTEMEMGYHMDMQLIGQLESMGDTLTTPREVTHCFYFPLGNPPGMQACIAELESQGFEVEITPDDPDEPRDQTQVIANRDDAIEPSSICPVTAALRELADEHGGQYDGWETGLAKD